MWAVRIRRLSARRYNAWSWQGQCTHLALQITDLVHFLCNTIYIHLARLLDIRICFSGWAHWLWWICGHDARYWTGQEGISELEKHRDKECLVRLVILDTIHPQYRCTAADHESVTSILTMQNVVKIRLVNCDRMQDFCPVIVLHSILCQCKMLWRSGLW